MRKFIFIPFLISLFVNCSTLKNRNRDIDMSLDTEPVKIFLEILGADETNNLSNAILNKKIDSLLSMPVYKELEKNMIVYTKEKKYYGENAYRFAFENFNRLNFNMTGGANEIWQKFLNNKKNEALNFIQEVNSDKTKIIQSVNKYVKELLPENSISNQPINIVLCIDGNRGSFESEKYNMVVMDLTDFSNFDINFFTKIVAHETHHVIYGKWLDKHYKVNNERDSIIFDYQKGLIMEGIAQQINFNDYPPSIKNLYFNRQLIEELSNEWFDSFRNLIKTKNPKEYYDNFIYEMWATKSVEKLKKYLNRKLNGDLYSRRPTIPYYIGYYLYYSITKNGGGKELSKVISHPEQLLIVYNHLRKENDLIPKIPDDILNIWYQNLDTLTPAHNK